MTVWQHCIEPCYLGAVGNNMQENAEGSELIIWIWEFAVRFWSDPSESKGIACSGRVHRPNRKTT